jgi:hypothetical protein
MSGDNTKLGTSPDATVAVRFTAGRCDVFAEHPEPHDGAAVWGVSSQPFLLISDSLCADGDALWRAQALARLLNGMGWDGVLLLQEAVQVLQARERHDAAGQAPVAGVASIGADLATRMEAWLAGGGGEPTIGEVPDQLQVADQGPELQLVVNGTEYRTRQRQLDGKLGGCRIKGQWDGRTSLRIEVGPYQPGPAPVIVYGQEGVASDAPYGVFTYPITPAAAERRVENYHGQPVGDGTSERWPIAEGLECAGGPPAFCETCGGVPAPAEADPPRDQIGKAGGFCPVCLAPNYAGPRERKPQLDGPGRSVADYTSEAPEPPHEVVDQRLRRYGPGYTEEGGRPVHTGPCPIAQAAVDEALGPREGTTRPRYPDDGTGAHPVIHSEEAPD